MRNRFSLNRFSSFAESESELKEEFWFLGADYFTKDNLYWGAIGEKVVKAAVQINFKRRLGYHIKANRFNNQTEYAIGAGMDITLEDMHDGYTQIAAIEVKNLSEQRKPYGIDFAIKHILSRSTDLNPNAKKILVITFSKLLTKNAELLLTQEGWTIIEVGERLTSMFFNDLNKLYKLAAKIKLVVQDAIKPKAIVPRRVFCSEYKKDSTLDDYSTVNIDTIANSTLNENKIHDTPTIDDTNTMTKLDIIIDNLAKIRDGELGISDFYR